MQIAITVLKGIIMRINDFHISKEILRKVDIMNTLNGGISKPTVLMLRQNKRYLVKVRMPGVEPGKMRIEVQNDKLFLFHDISIQTINLLEEKSPVPFNIGYVLIPFDVDIYKINALYEGHELQITLPFNDLAGGYRKNIDIDQ
jgi:HSP20 family molecular chaperone IbpA